jgi:hypothetical protein
MLSRPRQVELRLSALKDVVEMIAALAVAGTAALALVQYEQSLRETRVTRSIEMVMKFEDDRLGKATEEVDELALLVKAEGNRTLDDSTLKSLGSKRAGELKDQFVQAIVFKPQSNGRPSQVPTALVSVIGYFNELEVCVEKGACDSGTVHAFLDEYADSVWFDFKPIVDHERLNGRPRFGIGLQQFISHQR